MAPQDDVAKYHIKHADRPRELMLIISDVVSDGW